MECEIFLNSSTKNFGLCLRVRLEKGLSEMTRTADRFQSKPNLSPDEVGCAKFDSDPD